MSLGVQEYMSTRDTGVQEIQEYQMSGNNIIIMHMPGNTGVRCQV